jgi:integrase
LEAASSETLPYWVLGGFAGLRSSELRRLEWEDISFEHKLVEVPATKSKTGRSRRLIPLRPGLDAWLAPYKGRTGKILPVSTKRLALDRARAGLTTLGVQCAPALLRQLPSCPLAGCTRP